MENIPTPLRTPASSPLVATRSNADRLPTPDQSSFESLTEQTLPEVESADEGQLLIIFPDSNNTK